MSAAVESSSSRQPFPWDEVMRAGFGLLRLSSRDFWAMTPRELGAVLGPVSQNINAPSRMTLDALMHAFPDR
ncbi:rcc01693 family protein [Brucella gallinifaecis]|uniref:Phage tail assembly chaperone n=1 Tax=Brucella gallinifaecis TaxID=215590 RepID=A0A502BNG4_9HYPH|nr:rcc01693 family protein [Brucella gallinifaecis]TPF76062.1 phage tail assembly chaperone [Brucella gallinifaecis]